MSSDWKTIKERGSPFLIKLISWITLNVGRPVGRFLLHPISFYFLLFNRNAVKSSGLFLDRALNRKSYWNDHYRHIFTFASTILDRVYMLTNNFDKLEITLFGYDKLISIYNKRNGCLVLGSHLGSFEILRALAQSTENVKFKALMYQQNAEKINSVLHALNPSLVDNIISIGQADTMLKVKEAFEHGEAVGILADRIGDSDRKTIDCQFFGQSVEFPTSPAIISSVLNVPAIVFFGLYLGDNRYHIHFELLSIDTSVSDSNKADMIKSFTQSYAEILEKYCLQYPYNWFNFYDYFKDG